MLPFYSFWRSVKSQCTNVKWKLLGLGTTASASASSVDLCPLSTETGQETRHPPPHPPSPPKPTHHLSAATSGCKSFSGPEPSGLQLFVRAQSFGNRVGHASPVRRGPSPPTTTGRLAGEWGPRDEWEACFKWPKLI